MLWNTHINKLAPQLSKAVDLFILSDMIPLHLKKAIYCSHFYSRLPYCSVVWGNKTTMNYAKLELLQTNVLRIFDKYFGDPKDLPTNPLFIKHNLVKASKLYDYKLFL